MPRTYMVRELFGPTIQGEGGMTGTPCHFLRFAGCNMWDGREQTRNASACPFCDTQFLGGERMTALQIMQRLERLGRTEWITITGGEPMLQLNLDLLKMLHSRWQIAIETNGTIEISNEMYMYLDHVTMSPKVPRTELKQLRCHSLKLLYPHPDPRITPESFWDIGAHERFLQPITPQNGSQAGMPVGDHAQVVIDRLTLGDLPGWRLSLQTHQMTGVL